jgi:hypothetical protein
MQLYLTNAADKELKNLLLEHIRAAKRRLLTNQLLPFPALSLCERELVVYKVFFLMAYFRIMNLFILALVAHEGPVLQSSTYVRN